MKQHPAYFFFWFSLWRDSILNNKTGSRGKVVVLDLLEEQIGISL